MRTPIDVPASDYPLTVNNANELFGYNVMAKNDYPPLVIAWKFEKLLFGVVK